MRINTGRVAGLLYLTVVLSGIFSLAYTPSRIPTADPETAIGNILAAESLFRAGILAGLICYTAFLILPLALYRLLHGFGRHAAVVMVALAVVSVPIALNALAFKISVLSLVQDSGLPPDLLKAQVGAALRSYRADMLVAQLFWGLWLLPLGYLILISAVVPRLFGILLILGCAGYVATVAGEVMIADFSSLASARWIRLPGSVGEIGTCLWLVLIGARVAQDGDC